MQIFLRDILFCDFCIYSVFPQDDDFLLQSLDATGRSYIRFFRVRPHANMSEVFRKEKLLEEMIHQVSSSSNITSGRRTATTTKPTLVLGLTTHPRRGNTLDTIGRIWAKRVRMKKEKGAINNPWLQRYLNS